MGWRTIHYCDMCGAENVELTEQTPENSKCDTMELCPVCLQLIDQTCEATSGSCDINDEPIAVWDLNLYCYCPTCNNYINAFNKEIWEAYNQKDIFDHEYLTITCPYCSETFDIKTILNVMVK